MRNWDKERSIFETIFAAACTRAPHVTSLSLREWLLLLQAYRMVRIGDAPPRYRDVPGLYLQTSWEFWQYCIASDATDRDTFEAKLLEWAGGGVNGFTEEHRKYLKGLRRGNSYVAAPTTRDIAPAWIGWRIAARYKETGN